MNQIGVSCLEGFWRQPVAEFENFLIYMVYHVNPIKITNPFQTVAQETRAKIAAMQARLAKVNPTAGGQTVAVPGFGVWIGFGEFHMFF